jgi:hypothetical protein
MYTDKKKPDKFVAVPKVTPMRRCEEAKAKVIQKRRYMYAPVTMDISERSIKIE